MATRLKWLLAPQAVCSCVTVGTVAQWLRLLDCKWQREALAVGNLCHMDSIKLWLIVYRTCQALYSQLLELH